MRRRPLRWLPVLAAALLVVAAAAATASAGASQPAAPVPSLEPEATERLWRQLVTEPRRSARATQTCRPLRAVFYAQTDWLRLATRLAAQASPCAQYYVSVPPFAADKTRLRAGEADRIRALGPNFHPVAEIHFAGWTRWVAANGTTWHNAGATARARMAAAGFDVSRGDTWAVNELTSAVRRGDGNARANIREFLRGLYEGNGSQPTRGIAFVIGVGQPTTDVSVYQINLQNWFTDAAFWQDMAAYVSDWSQEVYGDIRNFAVPGMPLQTRRDYLNDYLQHQLVLAAAGPPTIEPARAYLRGAYAPLANAAWQWESAYGWTSVAAEQMAAYAAAQVYALRFYSVVAGQPQDHWGFAWAPRNTTGVSGPDFAAQTGLVLDRLAAAIRDSADTPDPNDPGSAACGPPGQPVACALDLEGSRFTEAWKSLRTWTQPVLAFTTPPPAVVAGTPSAAIGLAVQTVSGAAHVPLAPVTVTLTSSSPQGMFSTSPTGPFAPTLTLTIGPGTNLAPPVYYQDTRAGSPVLTAAAAGFTSVTQTASVLPGPPVTVRLTPLSATLTPGRSQRFSLAAADTFGNAVPVTPAWALDPPTLGRLTVDPTGGAVVTAAPTGGRGVLTGSVPSSAGTLSATATVIVMPGRLRVSSVRYGVARRALLVTVRVGDLGGRPVAGARVAVVVRRNGRRFAVVRARTGSTGRVTYRVAGARGGCYTTTVTAVAAPGYVWTRAAPAPRRFCR